MKLRLLFTFLLLFIFVFPQENPQKVQNKIKGVTHQSISTSLSTTNLKKINRPSGMSKEELLGLKMQKVQSAGITPIDLTSKAGTQSSQGGKNGKVKNTLPPNIKLQELPKEEEKSKKQIKQSGDFKPPALTPGKYAKSLPHKPNDAIRGKTEVISKRDLYSKTYDNGDGTFTARINAGPIHYEKNGRFLDIEFDIVPHFDHTFPYINSANLFQSYFGATSHKGVKNKTDEGEVREFLNVKMYWESNGQKTGVRSAADVPLAIKEDRAYYKNIFDHIDVEFTILRGTRELNYIIPDKAALGTIPAGAEYLVFSEDIALPIGWTHEETSRGISIKNNLGKEIFFYPNPFSEDANLETAGNRNILYETLMIGSTLTVKTKVSTSWLLDSVRVFPVKVDPTVTVTTINSPGWTGYTTLDIDDGDGDDYDLDMYLGYQGGWFTNRWSMPFVRINTESIPPHSTITNVDAWLYKYQGSNTATPSGFGLHTAPDPLVYFDTWLFPDIDNGTPMSLYYGADPWNNSWYGVPLESAGRDYISDMLPEGYFAAGVVPAGDWDNRVRFRPYNHTNSPEFDITYTAPSCPGPNLLDVTNITANSARISWTHPPSLPSQGYQYYYNTTGTPPGGGPSGSVTNAFNYADLSGLTSDRVWHFWVRSRCGSSSYGNWTYGGYFNTLPNNDCIHDVDQGQARGPVENGYGIRRASGQKVADDFVVPPGFEMTVKRITLEVMASGNPNSRNFEINLLDAALNIVHTLPAQTPNYTSPLYNVFSSSLNTYHVSFEIPDWVLLAGQYWVQPEVTSGSSQVYWRSTLRDSYGAEPGIVQPESDPNWYYLPNFAETIFFVAGECKPPADCGPVTVTSDKYVVCEGEEITLTASGPSGMTFRWYEDYDPQTGTTIGSPLHTGASWTFDLMESSSFYVIGTKTGCPTSGPGRPYGLIAVAVTPPPEVVVTDPIDLIVCTDDYEQIDALGGLIPEQIIYEDFTPIQHPWIINAQVTGGDPWDALWFIYLSGGDVNAPNGHNFAMVDSDYYGFEHGLETMYSSFISPPLSFLDYDTPIDLTFNHFYLTDNLYPLFYSFARVEISTDGGFVWDTVADYSGVNQGSPTNWKSESINLNAYAGEPFVLLRFYYEAQWDRYWGVTDIEISGDPLPSIFTWSPYGGLYMDNAGATPYTGQDTSTVYVSPTATTTYTVTSSTAVGCPTTAEVTVNIGDRLWANTGGSTNWNTASRWTDNTVPTIDHCVRIPNMPASRWPVIRTGTHAEAKNVTVDAGDTGGGLTINSGGSLTIADFLKINPAVDAGNVVVSDSANLIQWNPDAINTGKLTTEHYVRDMNNIFIHDMDYVYWSSPVDGQNLHAFSPGTDTNHSFWAFLEYDEQTDYFENTMDTDFLRGKGYAIAAETNAVPPNPAPANGYNKTYKFAGEPHNGPIPVTLSNTHNGYNLVGNPYPSNIDAEVLFDMNSSSIYRTIWLWTNNDPVPYQQGGDYSGNNYAIYNTTGGTPASVAASPGTGGYQLKYVPDGIIRSGQGFLVQVRDTAPSPTTSMVFNNLNTDNEDMLRVTVPAVFFQKGDKDRYWITLTSPARILNTALVGYIPGATDGFDGDYDAQFFGASDAIYSLLDGQELIIQGRQHPLDLRDVVPLGINGYEDGVYVIALENPEGQFTDLRVYLIDKELGIAHNLSNEPYKFFSLKGKHHDRFEIRYRRAGFSTSANPNMITAATQKEDIIILSTQENIREVQLFDILGMEVYQNVKVDGRELRIPASRWMNSILFARIITEDGEVTTTKVLLK